LNHRLKSLDLNHIHIAQNFYILAFMHNTKYAYSIIHSSAIDDQ